METIVFVSVLAAAVMHASWNAVVKLNADPFSSILVLALAHGAIALALIPFFPLPLAASWPWLAASALLHSGYKLTLIRAYAHGELSQIYPLARGTAPLLVALVGLGIGEALSALQALAVVIVAAGVLLMSLKGGTLGALPLRALATALATAAFTCGYTLVDGIGARLSGTASGFALWMFLGDTMVMIAYAGLRHGLAAFPRLAPVWRSGLMAGAMSIGSYWVAIWAMTLAPIALVAALRETSVLFSVLIAALFLEERPGPWRWAAAGLITCGVALMRM